MGGRVAEPRAVPALRIGALVALGVGILLLSGSGTAHAKAGRASEAAPTSGAVEGAVSASLDAGELHTCLITPAGNVDCWGINEHGQAADRTGEFIQVSAGGRHTCALTVAGEAQCWGENTWGQAPASRSTFVQLSAGDSHTCGVRPGGDIDCWGRPILPSAAVGGFGYMGQAEDQSGPHWVQVSSGDTETCGVDAFGEVYCWGEHIYENFDYSFGVNNPIPGAITQVAKGHLFGCGLRATGNIDCWGRTSVYWPQPDQVGPFLQVSAGQEHACGLRANGAVDCWGIDNGAWTHDRAGPFVQVTSGRHHNCGLLTTGAVECWGLLTTGRPADGTGSFASVDAGNSYSCALRNNGSADCWGLNSLGQAQDQTGPFTQVSAGGVHSCAVRVNGEVECWGYNSEGQADDQTGPFLSVSAPRGGFFSCGLRADANVDCWGDNAFGRAEDQHGVYIQVSTAQAHACALAANGDIDCWGRNLFGETQDRAGPFIQVSVGDLHTCGLLVNGLVDCWGFNGFGQVFDTFGTHLGEFVQVRAGGSHTCALRPSGVARCWGDNRYGQSSPPTGAFSELSAGEWHTCGRRTTGQIECWGQDVPDLTITKTHSDPFQPGQAGAAYTITVTNSGGGQTDGSEVTVTDVLPAGLTARSISGTGWACTLSSLKCTRSGSLNAGESYPPITLTVDVALNAPSSVTNVASVGGGGESNKANNGATDPTTVALTRRPTIDLDGPDEADEGQTRIYTYTASDPDGDPLDFSVSCGVAGELVEDSHIQTVTASSTEGSFECNFPDGPDDTEVGVEVDDDELSATDTIEVSIANVASTVVLQGPTTVSEGETYTMTFSVTDPGLDTFALKSGFPQCEQLGALQTLTATGGSFTCHARGGPTDNPVRVQVVDSDSGASNLATAMVHTVNVAPVVSFTLAPSQVDESRNDRVLYEYDVFDPGRFDDLSANPSCGDHGDVRPLSVTRPGMGGTEGSFECVFPDGPNGSTISVRINDGHSSGSASTEVEIDNVAATVSMVTSPRSTPEGGQLLFEYQVIEPGVDTFEPTDGFPACGPAGELVSESHQQGNGFFPPGGNIRCRFPDGPATGTVRMRTTDSDGAESATVAVEVTVTNVAPIVSLTGVISVDEGNTESYEYSIEDPGDETFTSTVACGLSGSLVLDSHVPGDDGGEFRCRFPDGPSNPRVLVVVNDGDAEDSGHLDVTVDNVKPTVELTGPAATNEGTTATYTYSFSDPGDDPNPSIDEGCGTATPRIDTPAPNSFNCLFFDGPSSKLVEVVVNDGDPSENVGRDSIPVSVANVAPTATFGLPVNVDEGATFALALTNPVDVVADSSNLMYAFDCGDGAGYGAFSSSATRNCPTTLGSIRSVRGKVKDKDGDQTEYTGTVTVLSGRSTKQSVIDSLKALLPTIASSSRGSVTDAIKELELSVAAALWKDNSHPDPKKGKDVFEHEEEAVEELMEIKNPPAGITTAITRLWQVDRTLATTALREATAANVNRTKLREAQKEFDTATREAAAKHYDNAIYYFGKSWERSIEALKR